MIMPAVFAQAEMSYRQLRWIQQEVESHRRTRARRQHRRRPRVVWRLHRLPRPA